MTATSTIATGPARRLQSAIWTGDKMIVWGGISPGSTLVDEGGVYDPVKDSWRETPIIGAPSNSTDNTAVWTGSKMIVWGGENTTFTNNGAIYDYISNSWSPTYSSNGGVYNPSTDSWETMIPFIVSGPRQYFTTVWTGSEMIIWGGRFASPTPTNTGAKYTPNDGSTYTKTVSVTKDYYYFKKG